MAVRMTMPVTILTGFLGSGKTTLVNRILREPMGERVAVIENEYGEVGVDAEFLAHSGEETIIQLENGCLCCTVRGDLARALHELASQARERNIEFERVLIETTGLADPGPIIQTFLAETAIESLFHLDGIVTVVDAVHATTQAGRLEFRAQVAYADRIVVSKVDLLEPEQQAGIEAWLTQWNPRAPVVACDLHAADMETLCGHLFQVRGFAVDYVPPDEVRRALHGPAWGELDGRWRRVGAAHTEGVVSCVFRAQEPLALDCLNEALDGLIQRYGERLWRCKGIVHAEGLPARLVLQGVQGLIQIGGGTLWRPFEPRQTVLVFIGEGLEAEVIQEALQACVTTQPA